MALPCRIAVASRPRASRARPPHTRALADALATRAARRAPREQLAPSRAPTSELAPLAAAVAHDRDRRRPSPIHVDGRVLAVAAGAQVARAGHRRRCRLIRVHLNTNMVSDIHYVKRASFQGVYGTYGASRSRVQPHPRAIAHAIVQPRRLALPQLDHLGHDAIAAPVRRARRRRVAVRALDLRDQRLERGPALDHLRLRRRDRAELAAARPRREVRVGRRGVDLLDRAFDPDLAVQRLPEQDERRERMRGEVAALAPVVVREEHEAARRRSPSAARCAPPADRDRRRWRASSRSRSTPDARPPTRIHGGPRRSDRDRSVAGSIDAPAY